MEKEFDQNKKFVPTKSFSEYVEEWKNCKKYENPLMQTTIVQQLESRIKELEDNTTELIKRSGDITHDYWYYCQECLHNFEIDEEFNFCPNCGRRIVR